MCIDTDLNKGTTRTEKGDRVWLCAGKGRRVWEFEVLSLKQGLQLRIEKVSKKLELSIRNSVLGLI
jgi:hypothetical protein